MITDYAELYKKLVTIQNKNEAISANKTNNNKSIDDKIKDLFDIIMLLVSSVNEIQKTVNALQSHQDDYETYKMEQSERRE